MIISFYDKNFKGLQNNASLVIDKDSFNLVKRPIELNSFSCVCEAFTEDIQPVFLVVENDIGTPIYSALAGIPLLNSENKTEINATDLKSIFSSDVLFAYGSHDFMFQYIKELFNAWNEQVNKKSFNVELNFTDSAMAIPVGDLEPTSEKAVYNVYDELKKYLLYYALYIDSNIDFINKKVIFTIGKMMVRNLNIKLWEYGIKNYGKRVADVNESQGYYKNGNTYTAGFNWILTSKNLFTTTDSFRDIFPIKRKIVISEESLAKANEESLTILADSLYNENIELSAIELNPDFETNFAVYLKKGGGLYKNLPCGELTYNSAGLIKFKIGFRYDGVEFI